MSEGQGVAEAAPSVARSAAILSLGNVLSRALGMLREIVIPHYFGATGLVSAFAIAEFSVRTLYDLLVGGMLTAALVPGGDAPGDVAAGIAATADCVHDPRGRPHPGTRADDRW